MNKRLRASLLLLTTAMVWGFAFVAQKVGSDYVGPFTFNGIRLVVGAASLVPVILLFERKKTDSATRKNTWIGALWCGLVMFAAVNLQQLGIQLTGSAGKAAFISGLYTVLVPIAGIFLHKKTSLFTWLGALAAVGGLYLISVAGNDGMSLGDLLLLLDACLWTAHILTIDHFSNMVSPIRMSALQFLIAGAMSLLCAFLFENVQLSGIQSALLPILYGGVMSTGVGYTLQLLGQRDAPPAASAILLSLEAVFSLLGGALLLGERLTLRGYLGCAMMLAGILLSQSQVLFRKKAVSLQG